MTSKFITVQREKLAKIIILADNAEKLSEQLETNNQDCRVLLHSLISDAKRKNQIRDPGKLLLDYKENKK